MAEPPQWTPVTIRPPSYVLIELQFADLQTDFAVWTGTTWHPPLRRPDPVAWRHVGEAPPSPAEDR